MQRILTGLKPTGDLTLGNYIGSIKQMIELQDKYDSFIFVADLHALTIFQNPEELKARIRKFIALYIACGIDALKRDLESLKEVYQVIEIDIVDMFPKTIHMECVGLLCLKDISKTLVK